MNCKSFILFLLLLGVFACRKTPPQSPSNKNVPIDSLAEAMTAINQNLATREDSIIGEYVKKNLPNFQKSHFGFWFHFDAATQNPQINDSDIVDIDYQLFNFENKLLFQENIKTKINKNSLPKGLEQGILMMRRGESATFIVPWYLAFGMRGNDKVPPFTSVIYKVNLK